MKQRKILGCLAALAMTLQTSAQWLTSGNTINGGEWFGADGGSTVPLQVRHDANYPIQWFTDAIQRMMLQETATYGIGQFNGQVKNGALLLCPDVDQFYTNGVSWSTRSGQS
ncbi:MAG TPA: hypothetical protein PKY96_19130 [Flavobacteriales bacterium]|nr:hypothetical protein [Flavobacteriales bacterium]